MRFAPRRPHLAGVSALVIAALGASALAAPVPPPSERDRIWPQSYSDLPADPAMRFGVLPNGMRYALMHNDTPTGQTALRLRIGSGSLQEADDQQGLAHLLEHMAFKGSVHAPGTDNQFVKILERLGLSFGGDTNARTDTTDTVYQLDLPNSDPHTLDTGLTLMSDIGSGLLLEPKALQSERGVVLSEERQSDSPDYEVYKARLKLELQGQKAADRLPIGLTEVIRNAPVGRLRDFYQANYRPDRATLIAVGDFDPAAMEADIRRVFGNWKGSGAETAEVDVGHPLVRGFTPQLLVRTGARPSLAIAWTQPRDLTPDTVAKERRDFVDGIAMAALNRRYARAAHAPDAPFLAAGGARGDMDRSVRLSQLQATFRPADWRRALDALVGIERQALRYGFTPEEVQRELVEQGVRLRNAEAGASTRRTPALAEELVRSVEDQDVDTSPAEDLRLYDSFAKTITPAEVNAALRDILSGQGPIVSLALPTPIDGGEAALTAAFRQAEAAPLIAPQATAALQWRHTRFGADGQVIERREVKDLGVTFVRFANGVRLAVRPSPLLKDQVLVSVNFGHGRLSLPLHRIAADWASSALIGGGLTDLTQEDIQQVLADRTVSVGLGVGDDAFSLTGATRPQDLDLQIQLLAAYMTAPGWRPEAFAHVQASTAVALAQLTSTPQGVEARDLPALIHSGDARWLYPTLQEVRATKLSDVKTVLDPALAAGPLEVIVAGDVTVDSAVRAVAATFGALPARPIDPYPASADEVRFPAPTSEPVSRTHDGRSDQAMAYQGWAAADMLSDTQRARRLNLAAEILELRLTDQLRTAQGATYSPGASAYESEVFPHYGYLYASVETPPSKIAGFYDATRTIAADLAARPVGADELQRAMRPRVEGIERAKETNAYWLAMLHDADKDPRRLELIRSSPSGYLKITPADIQETAREYLQPSRAWRFQVTPVVR